MSFYFIYLLIGLYLVWLATPMLVKLSSVQSTPTLAIFVGVTIFIFLWLPTIIYELSRKNKDS